MADTALFSRLKRLFSTQAVIRNTGGKRLRVVDTAGFQGYGTRASVDRYRRIYKTGQYGYAAQGRYDMYSSYQQARLQLFRDYDLMDNDPIISSVLDIYADESTVKNEFGEILSITSGNDQVQKALYNLFYDILNIEFFLWPWIRNMCKYGDFYLYMVIDEQYGVSNVLPMSVYEVHRIEGDAEDNNPFAVKFKIENDYSYLGRQNFENYEIAHFRLLSDANFLPYGKSMLENGRRIHKQLRLMEDAMLIHRITRAPDKRIFKVDVGNIPPSEVESYMERLMNKIKRQPLIDQNTGDYNLKYNMQNIVEDFIMPVRGKDTGTEIVNLQGLSYNAIEDIEYLLRKLMAAFKVPKSFMGYEEDTSGKATLAAQDVRFARTIERIQRITVSELTKMAIVHLYVLGFRDEELVNFELSLTNPSMVYELEKMNLWKEKITLATTITQSKFLSREWIYNNIIGLTDEEMVIEQEKIVQDAKYEGNIQKVAQEAATQPVPAGEGQPPDQQSNGRESNLGETDDLYGAEQSVEDTANLLALKKQKHKARSGRPKEGHKYRSDKDKLGRDPLGYKEILAAMDVLPKNKINGKTTVSPRIKEDSQLDVSKIINDLNKSGKFSQKQDKKDPKIVLD